MHTKNTEIKQCSTINTRQEVNGTDHKYYRKPGEENQHSDWMSQERLHREGKKSEAELRRRVPWVDPLCILFPGQGTKSYDCGNIG